MTAETVAQKFIPETLAEVGNSSIFCTQLQNQPTLLAVLAHMANIVTTCARFSSASYSTNIRRLLKNTASKVLLRKVSYSSLLLKRQFSLHDPDSIAYGIGFIEDWLIHVMNGAFECKTRM